MEAPLVEHRPPIVKRARANSRGVSNAMDRPERRIGEGLVAVGSRLAAVTVRPVLEVLEEIALATEVYQAAEAHAVPAGSAAEVEAAPDPAVRVALLAWAAAAGVVAEVAGVAGVVGGGEGSELCLQRAQLL
jgi:hypothetical protein